MKKHPLLFTAFGTLVILGVLHIAASALYIYWTDPWFDRLMHILGGLAIGLFGLWVWWVSGLFGKSRPTRKEAFITAICIGMLVGVGWEMFEFSYGLTGAAGGETYLEDTFLDLVSDFIGATIAGIIGARAYFYPSIEKHD